MLNMSQMPEQQEFSVIPDNTDVPVMIQIAERRDSANTPGCRMVKLTNLILAGEYKGRQVYSNGTYEHPTKPKAVMAGLGLLRGLMGAIGEDNIDQNDPVSLMRLCGKPVIARIKLIPPKDGYPASNNVKKYIKIDSEEGQKVVAACQAQERQAATLNPAYQPQMPAPAAQPAYPSAYQPQIPPPAAPPAPLPSPGPLPPQQPPVATPYQAPVAPPVQAPPIQAAPYQPPAAPPIGAPAPTLQQAAQMAQQALGEPIDPDDKFPY